MAVAVEVLQQRAGFGGGGSGGSITDTDTGGGQKLGKVPGTCEGREREREVSMVYV
jgi:hypothetical protein